MTTTTTTEQSGYSLPPDRLACGSCGGSTPRPGDRARVERRTIYVTSLTGQWRPSHEVELTRCADCQDRHGSALVIASSHPRATAALGEGIAGERIEAIIVALHLLGHKAPRADCTDSELGTLLRHLAQPGMALSYANRAMPGLAGAHPWSHVTGDDRAELRTAYAAVLAERVARVAPAVDLAPPDEPGTLRACLICGVSTVSWSAAAVGRLGGPANARRTVWEPMRASRSSLGGRGPETVAGWLCRACDAARESVGSVGPTLLETALATHLLPDAANRATLPFKLGGLVAWCVTGLPPSAQPWAHVGDLDALRKQVGAALAVA